MKYTIKLKTKLNSDDEKYLFEKIPYIDENISLVKIFKTKIEIVTKSKKKIIFNS